MALAAAAIGALTLSGLTASPSGAAARDARPLDPARHAALDADAKPFTIPVSGVAAGRHSYFVQLSGTGAADAASRARGADSKRVALSRREAIGNSAARASAAGRRADNDATTLFTTTNSIPGVAMLLDPAGVAALARESNVVKISRLPRYEVTNANAAQLVNAINTWRYHGNIGEGVRVGVIDTGIDYTHADFGGPGTTEAYEAAIGDAEAYNWRAGLGPLGQAKVRGGYDFVGDDYNADPSAENYQPVPTPTATRSTAASTAPTWPARSAATASTAAVRRSRATTASSHRRNWPPWTSGRAWPRARSSTR